MMPDMDGHMVLAELRKNPLTRDIPVIFVTAMNDPEEEERGISEGAADFVTKPVKPAVLIARVRAQIELSRAQQLLSSQKSWLEKEVARQVGENTRLENRLQLTLEGTGWHLGMRPAHSGAIAGARACARSSAMPRSRPPSTTTWPWSPRKTARSSKDNCWPQAVTAPRARWPSSACAIRMAAGTGWKPAAAASNTTPAPPDRRHPARHQSRKASEAERQLADLVFTGISDGICITDAQRNILRINKAFSHITGYEPADDARAEPAPAPLGQSRPRFLPRHVGKARPLRQLAGRDQNRRKDGSLSNEWLSISCVRTPPARSATTSACSATFRTPGGRRTHPVPVELRHADRPAQPRPVRRPPDQALLTARRFERGTALILFDLDRFRGAQRHARPAGRRPDPGRRWVVACNCRCGKAIPSAG
jgi:PAS domain-containing protein